MNKKVSDDPFLYLLLFVIIFFIFVMGLFYYNLLNPSNNPKINITKEECWNETENIQYSFPDDFNEITCIKEIKETNCYDNKDNIINGLTCEKKVLNCFELKNKNLSKGMLSVVSYEGYLKFVWYDSAYFVDERYGGNIYSSIFPIKEYKINQVCEQKEFEEIFDIKNCSGCFFEYGNGEEGGRCLNNRSCIYFNEGITIKKSDLTTDWLDKNCEKTEKHIFSFGTNPSDFVNEMKNKCDNLDGFVNKESDVNFVCWKDYIEYKCGDYTVKVNDK